MATVEEIYSTFLKLNQRFTTDTRNVSKGDIFFALKGGNFNGNHFAASALEQGAAICVVDEETTSDKAKTVRVDNVLEFMQSLATHHRMQFDIPVVAVAGSNGKTTTKELLVSVLSTTFKVHATKGNFNNHIGVPITLLSMPLDTEIGLIEIGTNGFGEIEFLSEMVKPSHGLITNIGKEHLEGFGSLEGVAREESALFHYLNQHNGFAFVNADDVYLNRMAHRLQNKRTYALDNTADLRLTISEEVPALKMQYDNTNIKSSLTGKHNAQNIACAVCVSQQLGVSDNNIALGISNYQPSNNRSEIKKIGSNSFLLDAYNANPSSMEAAINSFASLNTAHKVILLGDMFELGETALEEHKAIGDLAYSLNADVYLCGELFGKAFPDNDIPNDVNDLVIKLKQEHFEDTWFLVKGSRGMKMERILEAFTTSDGSSE